MYILVGLTRTSAALLVASLSGLVFENYAIAQTPAIETPTLETSVLTSPESAPPVSPSHATTVQYLASFELRQVWLPEPIVELALEESPAHLFNTGFSVGVTRRKNGTDLMARIGYDNLDGGQGIAINKGEPIPAYEADFVEFDGFSWISIEAMGRKRIPVAPNLHMTVGGGLGVGIVIGEILASDYVCTTSDPNSCFQKPGGKNKEPYNVWPVIPIVRGDVGVSYQLPKNFEVGATFGLRLPTLAFGFEVSRRFK